MRNKPLYKMDHNGGIRIWFTEISETAWRTHSGLMDGKQVISGWKEVPRAASQDTIAEQVIFEAEAARRKRLGLDYYETLADAKTGVPAMFQCMTAKKYTDPKVRAKVFAKHDYVGVQPKLDGIRCHMDPTGPTSRGNKPMFTVDHIFEYLADFFEANPDLTLDGELYNHDYHANFQELASVIRKDKPITDPEILEKTRGVVQYWIYDCAGGEGQTSIDRLRPLYEFLETVPMPEFIVMVPTVVASSHEQIAAIHENYLSLGYEGTMIRLTGPYEHKRSKLLLKNKSFDDKEFTVTEINEGVGNWAGCAKSIKLYDSEFDVTFDSGVRGTKEFLAGVLQNKSGYIGGQATVRFFGRSNDNIPRFGVVTDWHPDGRAD